MKLLLISDAAMNINGGGFSQTLYNVFSFAPPGDFLLITSSQDAAITPTSPPFDTRVLTYNLEIIPVQRNRLGKWLNGFIRQINYSCNLLRRFKRIRAAIKAFDADMVVVAPNGTECVFMYRQLKDAFDMKKVFPYFMDDWLYRANQKWMGGNVHAVTKSLLANHTSWMMISERLANIFAERYAVKPARLLAIHNPVNMEGLAAPAPIAKKTAYTMAYAGALWQMHFDAFLVIAKAVQLLQKSVDIRLVVYTSQSNWQWRHEELKSLNIEYGGHIPYAQIHSTLAEADCFLLTSSFSPEWQTHTKASVQTKLTDYLKAGRLIISCGPWYSANHEFLKKYNCGICIETDNEQQAAGKLEKILNNIEANQAYVQQGYAVLQNELSVNVVHERLKQFLAA